MTWIISILSETLQSHFLEKIQKKSKSARPMMCGPYRAPVCFLQQHPSWIIGVTWTSYICITYRGKISILDKCNVYVLYKCNTYVYMCICTCVLTQGPHILSKHQPSVYTCGCSYVDDLYTHLRICTHICCYDPSCWAISEIPYLRLQSH